MVWGFLSHSVSETEAKKSHSELSTKMSCVFWEWISYTIQILLMKLLVFTRCSNTFMNSNCYAVQFLKSEDL